MNFGHLLGCDTIVAGKIRYLLWMQYGQRIRICLEGL